MTKTKIEIVKIDRNYLPMHPDKKDCIVIDLDGTIALPNNRTYYNWLAYGGDKPDDSVINLIYSLTNYHEYYNERNVDLIVVTGRAEIKEARDITEKWLNKHIPGIHKLYMRKGGDRRSDYIAKGEIIDEILKTHNILAAFDDKSSSAQAFRDRGILCLQVDNPEYQHKSSDCCNHWTDFFKDKPGALYCPDCGHKIRKR